MSPDRHGIIHDVARILHHTQSRYIENDRHPGDQRLTPLRRSDGDAQKSGSEFRITAKAGPGATTSSQELNNTHTPSDGMVERKGKPIEKLEFYEYEVMQYDPQTGEGGHFVQYIDRFLKSKAEASGYPGWVQSPDDEDKYAKYFFESNGIELDTTAIQNAAKTGLVELCCNSFWGK